MPTLSQEIEEGMEVDTSHLAYLIGTRQATRAGVQRVLTVAVNKIMHRTANTGIVMTSQKRCKVHYTVCG